MSGANTPWLLAAVAALAALGAARPAPAQCEPGWSSSFGSDDLDKPPSVLAVFDDGGGPALYAGGSFTSAGGVSANHVAKWNGTHWSPLGSGTNGSVHALAAFDDDGPGPNRPALYAGGYFTSAGGVSAYRMAKWDGTQWSALGSGVSGSVFALTVFDDDGSGPHPAALYAGGDFAIAGGVTVNDIARWDGSTWAPLGSGMNDWVYALATFDDDGSGPHPPALYAAGAFTTAGGVGANRVARWDGTAWSALGSGTNDWASALAAFDDDGSGPHPPALYAAGGFTASGEIILNHIGKWDGQEWSPLGTGTSSGEPWTLAVFDDDGPGPHPEALYAGGDFLIAGGVSARGIAKWDGAAWSAVGGGMDAGVYDLAVFDPDGAGAEPAVLYAGGSFSTAGGLDAQYIAGWNGVNWLPLGGGAGGVVYALTSSDGDGAWGQPAVLYAGGAFTGAGSAAARRVAKWDGHEWCALGSGMNLPVYALTVLDDDGTGPNPPALYAGGDFTTAGAVSAKRVAKWDGETWSALGSGMNNWVTALAAFDDDGSGPHPPALYAGGYFTAAGGVSAKRVARWDGATWSALGNGLGGLWACAYALTVFDPDGSGPEPAALHVGGDFTSAGGVSASCIAKWDGTAWSALGSGMGGFNPQVYALAVFDDDGAGPGAAALYAAGAFTTAGGVGANHVAKWDGSAWSALGGGTDDWVYALAAFDADGAGPQPAMLYAGGAFTTAGGVSVERIARWDGHEWSPLGGGTNKLVLVLATFDDDGPEPNPGGLYLGGDFTAAGGLSSEYLGRWGCPPVLRADLNCDGARDPEDIDAFVLALVDPAGYAAAYPDCDIRNADCNCDGVINAFDLDPFVACLTAGCTPCP